MKKTDEEIQDGLPRCPWVDLRKPDYIQYHDEEWGVPVHEESKWFEFLTLESAQAGLSWYTVLKKRERYRKVFAEFNVEKVAKFTDEKVEKLMADPGIIRNRSKITAAINNARCFLKIQEEFGSFDAYMWSFVGGVPLARSRIKSLKDYPTTSKESDTMSKDLKSRGFRFLGSTICYAHMQATGLVNDHSKDCFRRKEIISLY